MPKIDQDLLPLEGLDAMPQLPRCDETGQNADLHLVVYTPEGEKSPVARILTTQARHLFRKTTSLSVPLWMLTIESLNKLEQRGSIPRETKAADSIRKWLQFDRTAAWRELFDTELPRQEVLDFDDESCLDFGE